MNMKSFGSCAAGDISAVTITDGQGMSAEIITLGAALRRLYVPDRSGNPVDVVLGYETAEDYMRGDYLGATVGRYANRIGNSEFTLNGVRYPVIANEGAHQLHGGPDGFTFRNFSVIPEEKKAVFRLTSPHMDQGFPGELQVEVIYSLETPGELKISYKAVSDRDTVVSMTNHAYFNLSGHASGTIDDQILSVAADYYTPADDELITNGEILSVERTDFDVRVPAPCGEIIRRRGMAKTKGMDHNMVLRGDAAAAVLESPRTGIRMETLTTEPGLQIYMSGGLHSDAGKDGAKYLTNHAICLETQHFPNSPRIPHFPSVVLKAGAEYRTETVYRFSAK